MENFTDYQIAWALYLLGAAGCALATWWLFRGLGRALVHFFVISVMVVVFTPYAIDPETMTMAPALYTLVFGYLDGGFSSIKPVLKLMLGLWGTTLILSLIYQLLTRHSYQRNRYPEPQSGRNRKARRDYYEEEPEQSYDAPRSNSTRALNREERIARDELLREEPIRAIR